MLTFEVPSHSPYRVVSEYFLESFPDAGKFLRPIRDKDGRQVKFSEVVFNS